MGVPMTKVMPNLYIGNIRDALNREQLKIHNITHILAIHDRAKNMHENFVYHIVNVSDNCKTKISHVLPGCIKFIHNARVNNKCVLVHCLAGISRSSSVIIAYIMVILKCSFDHALAILREIRPVAKPNIYFALQLKNIDVDMVNLKVNESDKIQLESILKSGKKQQTLT
ncbi:hypothetical protein A3Q56_00181 [Intoshia linei]|uniref:Uncharacterized protein n=1 Tax=Intoshia linei TaxID=1819745 RepID=A0A177BCW5_9BILA|nr:hypothetical protein A3Q56_00181 [Intoshia linei]